MSIHELLHEVETERCTPRGDDPCPVGIDHTEDAHRKEVGNGGNGLVEHERGPDRLEHQLAAGELDLCHRVCGERGEEQVAESSHDRDEHGVEDVT